MAEDRVRERGIGASGSVRAQAADRASQFLSFLRMPVVAQIAEDRVHERRFGARSYLSAQAADHARQGPSFLRTPMLPRIAEDRVCERGLGKQWFCQRARRVPCKSIPLSLCVTVGRRSERRGSRP